MATATHSIAVDSIFAGKGRGQSSALLFAASFLGFIVLAASLVIWKPIQLSIATVFLFAGPHNWIEFRFFLARMPLRWGKSKRFYSVGLGGLALLAAAYITLYWLGGAWYLSESAWTISTALWDTALILWVCTLVHIRGQERNSNRSWIFAIGFMFCAAVWIAPFGFSLAMVYVHPLIAMWFLDRELKRRRPHWRRAYHGCLGVLLVLIVAMWARLHAATNLPDSDPLSWRITQHAGAGILTSVSSHLLVATHILLEMVHYSAWLVLIPLVGLGSAPWRTGRIPLASAGKGWTRAVKFVLAMGVLVLLALWISFGVNYSITRDVYFTVAMLHVLAEAPFLIRLF
jgi:hypothetical protein